LLFLIVELDVATGILPGTAADLAGFVVAIAVMVYEWYIAKVALAVPAAQAMLVVLVDLMLGVVLSRVGASLY
jgi:hypothetical protein